MGDLGVGYRRQAGIPFELTGTRYRSGPVKFLYNQRKQAQIVRWRRSADDLNLSLQYRLVR